MNKFDFYIDTKITCWERDHFTVEAENYEEAEKIMKKEFDKPEYSDGNFQHSEILYETGEDMTVEENGGFSTKELFYNHETIMENGNG